MELPDNFDLDNREHMKALICLMRNLIPEEFHYSLTVYDYRNHSMGRVRTFCRAGSKEELIGVLRLSANDIEENSAEYQQAPKETKVKH